ncbi:MAG: ATP-dependent helicase HrpA [Betaproteobacteria bacterium]|nr:ATP-dependent helicase HrpA [Betaproteobacteria bacterium]
MFRVTTDFGESETNMKDQIDKKPLRRKTQRKHRNTMTAAELTLWHHLRHRQIGGAKFRRQHPFRDYVLDFVCLEQRLAIEVDGGQHATNTSADEIRTATLISAGFQVLRFLDTEVMENVEGVKEVIQKALQQSS